jgi:hypothetical protein
VHLPVVVVMAEAVDTEVVTAEVAEVDTATAVVDTGVGMVVDTVVDTVMVDMAGTALA